MRVNGRTRKMSRLVWEHYYGPIPQGMCVCHECDNRKCINIEHLFLGTNRDNILDRTHKGRTFHARGELSGMAKLKAKQVVAIKAFRYKISQRELAKMYGVTQRTIADIHIGKTWRHI